MNEEQIEEVSKAIGHIELEVSILADNESSECDMVEEVTSERIHLVSALYHLKQAGYSYIVNNIGL